VDAGRDLKVIALRGIVLQAIDLAAKVKVTVLSVHQPKNNSRSPGIAQRIIPIDMLSEPRERRPFSRGCFYAASMFSEVRIFNPL
jgi:hypothetical protein